MNRNIQTVIVSGIVLLFCIDITTGFSNSITPEREDSLAAASMNRAASQVLAPVYPYLAKYIADTFALHEVNGTGIDVGGGAGNLITQLCRHTPNMYWINADINPWYLPYVCEKAQKQNCQGQVGSIQADATNLPFREDFADVIVSRASFHFWDNMGKGFSEIKRVLKPGGKALIGRGLPPNMPIDTARAVRNKQNRRITGYNPNNFANDFKAIMKELDIKDYSIIIPKPGYEVKYGIWIVFTN